MSSLHVSVKELRLQYKESKAPVFDNLNLELHSGQWTCVLGSSGCGKTSLLRLMAGLISNEHNISGHIVDQFNRPIHHQIAYMAQQDLLLPWLNVVDNVCLKHRLNHGKPKQETYQKARQLLGQLGLAECALLRPESLSGGMRQRVALARTLMQDTPIVLMDEPFSALDAVTRHRLQNIAYEALKGRTVLLITHDPQEALRLGDQVWLFHNKRLKPVDVPDSQTPREVDASLGDYQHHLLSALQSADAYHSQSDGIADQYSQARGSSH